MADNFSNMGSDTNKAINTGIKSSIGNAEKDAHKFINYVKKSASKGAKQADKNAEQYEGSGPNKNKELNGKNNNQSSTTSKKNRNKASKDSSKKKDKDSSKSKNADNSIVGTGVYFYGHMSADIIRQIMDMFVLQVKPIGALTTDTTKSGNAKESTVDNTGMGSLINLMYDYMGNDGKKRTIKDLIDTNIPSSELQAQRLLDEMNGKTRWRIFNPDEAMEPNPQQFMAYNGSVGQMFRDLSNAPFNEIFWTHEADGKAKFNYRQTPFEQEEWVKLLQISIDNTNVISMDLTASDDEQYSLFDLESDAVLNDISNLTYLLPITDDYNELVARYGYKYMEVSSQYFFTDSSGSGLTDDELQKAQQTQEEESTDITAEDHYPSLSAINEYFHADSKKALTSKAESTHTYEISTSYGGSDLYGLVLTDLKNGAGETKLKADINAYQKAHAEMVGSLNMNALSELITTYKAAKGKLSEINYVNIMFPAQEQVYPTDSNNQDDLAQLKYILSKGYQYIGASTKRMKEAAQDMVLLSRGYLGSLQAYRLVQSYVRNAGQIPNQDYQSILKNTKHSALKKGVGTASTISDSGGKDWYARYNKYQTKLFNYFADASKFYSGTIVVTGMLGVEYGKKLYFTDKRRGVNWEFYIESVQHDFSFTTGWTTTIGVTRGLQVSKPNDPKRWSMYWGHGKAFTGGFFGELSLAEIIQQAKIREANEEDSGGNDGSDSTGSGSYGSDKSWRRPMPTTPSGGQTFGSTAGRDFPHDGVDYGGDAYDGHPIRAVHAGTIIQVGAPGHNWPSSKIGYVITEHTTDGHNVIYQEFGLTPGKGGKAYVSKGDKVKVGQKIGKLGHLDGSGSGDHVHIGVAQKGHTVWDHGGESTRGWLDLEKLVAKSKK